MYWDTDATPPHLLHRCPELDPSILSPTHRHSHLLQLRTGYLGSRSAWWVTALFRGFMHLTERETVLGSRLEAELLVRRGCIVHGQFVQVAKWRNESPSQGCIHKHLQQSANYANRCTSTVITNDLYNICPDSENGQVYVCNKTSFMYFLRLHRPI